MTVLLEDITANGANPSNSNSPAWKRNFYFAVSMKILSHPGHVTCGNLKATELYELLRNDDSC